MVFSQDIDIKPKFSASGDNNIQNMLEETPGPSRLETPSTLFQTTVADDPSTNIGGDWYWNHRTNFKLCEFE